MRGNSKEVGSEELFQEGLDLARAGKQELAISKWLALATNGDLDSAWCIMVANGILGKTKDAREWLSKLPSDYLEAQDKGVIAGQVLATGLTDLLVYLKSAESSELLHEIVLDSRCSSEILMEMIEQHATCGADSECCYIEDEEKDLLHLIARQGNLTDKVVDVFLRIDQPFYEEQYSMADMMYRLCRNATLSEESLNKVFKAIIDWPGMAEATQFYELLLAIEEAENFSHKLEKKFEKYLDSPHWNNSGTVREGYEEFISG
jgi:hypothetical protein